MGLSCGSGRHMLHARCIATCITRAFLSGALPNGAGPATGRCPTAGSGVQHRRRDAVGPRGGEGGVKADADLRRRGVLGTDGTMLL